MTPELARELLRKGRFSVNDAAVEALLEIVDNVIAETRRLTVLDVLGIFKAVAESLPLELSYQEDARHHWPNRWQHAQASIKALAGERPEDKG